MGIGVRFLTGAAVVWAGSAPAFAQRANENAVTNADDAFGTNVGLETTGIYTENDTRGFSPLKAGNSRIDGIYFDQVANLPGRLKQSTAIRVGFAAEDYPFHAPTGIADNRLKPWPTKLGASASVTRYPFGGLIADADLRLPVVKDHVGLLAGISSSETRLSSGQRTRARGWVVRSIVRFGGFELSPFVAVSQFTAQQPQPLVVVTGDFVPKLPAKRVYLGQKWADGSAGNNNFGVLAKGAITGSLSFRAGITRSEGPRHRNFSEIFTVLDATGLSSHRLISDPEQDIHSTSGEAQLAWRLGEGRWRHRIIAGYRGRDRYTESGGSDSSSVQFAPAILGTITVKAEPTFTYSAVNVGRVRQSAFMLGYVGQMQGVGLINVGLQRARYRADFTDAKTSKTTTTRDETWLYNATVGIDLTASLHAFIGTQRGLEDSGAAPESAPNRNEQLPATRTTQYEAGLRWRFAGGQLAVNAFQITKAYFAAPDPVSPYVQVGQVGHRGVEASLSGTFIDKRLSLLAGAVLMQPRVVAAAVDLGQIGERPAGTPSVYARLDANYRTDIFGGLTPTLALVYTGTRAAGSRPQASLGGKQLMLPGYATVDLGVRRQFHIGKMPASARLVVQNVFDTAQWRVVAANTLSVEERRRLIFTVAADF